MKTEHKRRILAEISDNLSFFDQSLKGYFLCPVCFNKIAIEELNEITEAHIIPNASGGTLKSWLCKKCNNTLGTNQDKWLGEYLNAIRNRSLFANGITKKGITIDGIELNGAVRTDNTGLDVLIYKNRNSPEVNEEVLYKLQQHKSSTKISIKIPLLSKTKEVKIGFITAAYLYGFSLFGYSWVQQNHFSDIRELIRCQNDVDQYNVHISNVVNDNDDRDHWFGISIINGNYVPCCKIFTKIIFFPPFYMKEALDAVKIPNRQFSIEVKRMSNISNMNYTKPLLLTVGDKVLVFPDKIVDTTKLSFVIYVEPETFNVTVLDQFVDSDFEKNHHVDKKIHLNISNSIRNSESNSST
jgi:hypothetical protein